MSTGLTTQFPNQGWEQMASARVEMLAAFDRARKQSKIHEVEVFHGKVAEAECRKWLSGFLPKRYGVTSGYIITPGLKANVKAPHFDVIIYDQLESPVLWIEDNPDSTSAGKSMALPVEYVLCVLEVKSDFSVRTVRAAIEHLNDLAPVMSGLDQPHERYPLHLPRNFSCGIVFFELRKENCKNLDALYEIVEGLPMRGFFGGLILRAEDHPNPVSGRIGLTSGEHEMTLEHERTELDRGMAMTNIRPMFGRFFGASVMWSFMEFARFSFDLLAMVRGVKDNRVSSFYGMGSPEHVDGMEKQAKET